MMILNKLNQSLPKSIFPILIEDLVDFLKTSQKRFEYVGIILFTIFRPSLGQVAVLVVSHF